MTTGTIGPTASVRLFYRMVDDGDIPGHCGLFTPDATYDRPGRPRLEGRDAMEHFYRYDRPIRSGRHQLDSVVAAGTEIAVRGSFRGDLRDGGGVAHRFAEFFRIGPDGRFTARETFFAVPHV